MTLIITDKLNILKGEKSITDFLPSPTWTQEKHHEITKYPFNINTRMVYKENTTRYLLEILINRYMVMQLRTLEYPGILEHIKTYCQENEIKKIKFYYHSKNNVLFQYLIKNMQKYQIEENNHKNNDFKVFTTTKTNIFFNIINNIKLLFIIMGTAMFIFIGKFIDMIKPSKRIKENFNLWMSFANNREKLDNNFLLNYNKTDLNFLYPNPKKLSTARKHIDFDHSIYRFGDYNVSVFYFLKKAFNIYFDFNLELSNLLKDIEEKYQLNFIKEYNSVYIFTLKVHMIHTLLLTLLLKNIEKKKEKKTLLVYRGGNANGIFYSCLNNNKFINILIPHGTEFHPLDHSIYYLLDYNILPSDKICRQWVKEDEQIKKYKCKHIGLGRPYYNYLQTQIKKKKFDDNSILKVGIVLTYETSLNTIKFIDEIITSFQNKSIITEFVIKQRPNLTYDLSKYKNTLNINEHNGDIFTFLNDIDLVVVGISNMGVVGMVALDAIYCDIPTIYYFNNLAETELGYSWDNSMRNISFFKEAHLQNYCNSFVSKKDLCNNLQNKAINLKEKIGDSSNATENIKFFLQGLLN